MNLFHTKIKKCSASVLVIACITMLCQGFVFADESNILLNNARISLAHPAIYGFFAILALAMMMGYCMLQKKKYLWMLMMLISVFVINVGYLALSLSKDVHEALLACRISYFGNSFMPLFLLLTLADICRFKIKKLHWYILLAITVIMSSFAISAGYGSHFYKSVLYQVINGNVVLVKQYAILHTIYGLYVYTYYFMSVAIAVYSILKKRILFLRYVTMVIAVSASSILVWTIERFISSSFEFLSVAYVLMEAMLMILYSEMTENGFLNCFQMVSDNQYAEKPEVSIEQVQIEEEAKNVPVEITSSISVDDDFAEVLRSRSMNEYLLTNREVEVLCHLVGGVKRKTIAEKMFVSENTVKYHVTSIYQKFGVSRREDLCNKISELIKQ